MSEPAPSLTVAVVARRLGVAPDTLRTWDRRYGLGPSHRRAGARRRYAPDDLARLEIMRRLILEGFPACEAAEAARAVDLPGGPDPEATPGSPPPRRPAEGSRSTTAARAIIRCALALDAGGMSDLIEAEIARRGVVQTWDEVIVPVLATVGHRWEAGSLGVETEHLLTEAVLAGLRGVTGRLEAPTNARPVVLACAPEEQHSLPLHALGAALAERHVEVRALGARVPAEALHAAVRRCGPAAVFVWSQDVTTGDPAPLLSLAAVRPPPVVVVGGPGWPDPLPTGLVHVGSLAEAREAVLRALGRRTPHEARTSSADAGPARAARRPRTGRAVG